MRYRKIKRTAGGTIALLLMVIGLSSCFRFTNVSTAKQIEQILEEKYNETFVVSRIGKKDAFDPMSEVTAYCYPESNQRALFEVEYNPSTKNLREKYLQKKLSLQAEDEIVAYFQDNHIDAVCSADVAYFSVEYLASHGDLYDAIQSYPVNDSASGISPSDGVSPSDGINPSDSLSFPYVGFTVCVFDTGEGEKLYDLLCEFFLRYYRLNPRVCVGSSTYNIPVASKSKCTELFSSSPYVSGSSIRNNCDAYGRAQLSINDGVFSRSKEDYVYRLNNWTNN